MPGTGRRWNGHPFRGKRAERLIVVSLALFLAGCVGCALAWIIWALIGFRALAGAGGAVFPLSFGIIRDEFPREKVGVAIHRFVPESPVKTRSRLDIPGALLLSAGLVCLLLALTEGENWGWTSGRVLGLGAASLGLLAAWVVAELRVPEPMVDMRMMASRQGAVHQPHRADRGPAELVHAALRGPRRRSDRTPDRRGVATGDRHA